MSDALRMAALLLGVAALTSIVGFAIGRRGSLAGLVTAGGVMLETVGATVLFFVANLVVGVTLILAARYVSVFYATLYEVTDVTLLILSFVQAVMLTAWRQSR